jgi:hypothetical protein
MRFGVERWGGSIRVTGASTGASGVQACLAGLLRDVYLSARPRATRAIRRAHPRDVPGGTGPCGGRATPWRHRGVAVQAHAALGRHERVRAPAGRTRMCLSAIEMRVVFGANMGPFLCFRRRRRRRRQARRSPLAAPRIHSQRGCHRETRASAKIQTQLSPSTCNIFDTKNISLFLIRKIIHYF